MDRVVAVCTEVTEQVKARAARVEKLAAQASQASRAKDEFLAMLGHELRNPLAPMRTALQLMRLRGSESREQDVLERQVTHLSRLVDDLLDVSRITRGTIELERRPVELSEVVLRAMEIASPVLEHAHHEVLLAVPRKGLGVDVDIERMAQVVSNLLTNAAKYSDARSRIWVIASAASLRLSVGRVPVSTKVLPAMPSMTSRRALVASSSTPALPGPRTPCAPPRSRARRRCWSRALRARPSIAPRPLSGARVCIASASPAS